MSDRYTDEGDYDAGEYGPAGSGMQSSEFPYFILFIIGIVLYPTVLDHFLTGVCWLLRKTRMPLLTAYKFYWLAALSPTIGVILFLASRPNGLLIPAICLVFFVFVLSAGSIRSNEHKTIVGPVRYARNGEWAEGRVLLVQFTGIKDKDVEQFRQPGKQVIVAPEKYKSGQLRYPYEKARKGG
jgi:hypothetical protein